MPHQLLKDYIDDAVDDISDAELDLSSTDEVALLDHIPAGSLLEQEIRTYFDLKSAVLKDHEGEYILIKGDKVIDYFASEDSALTAGYERFPAQPFFVHLVAKHEQVYYL